MRSLYLALAATTALIANASAQSLPPQEPIALPEIAPLRLEHGKPLGAGPAKENSGIVKSRNFENLFWMHNDSGDEPRIYPVRRDGTVYVAERYGPDQPGTLIGGAINVDWEDITTDNRGHLIVADSGNNANDRRDLVLYILPEPSPTAGRTSWSRRVFFRYPDQHQFPAPKNEFNFDSEALFMLGEQLYLLSKHRSDTQTTLYRFHPEKWRADEFDTLELVDRFELHGQATAADASPDGRRLIVCTYNALWLFDVDDPNQPLRGNVAWLPLAGPEEVEAGCFADDRTILVADEGTGQLFEIPLDKFVPVRSATDVK
jgi:hypothetical protein